MYREAQSEQEIIHSYLNGDESALEQLIRMHKQRVYTTIYLFVKDKYLAEDIFQDTFMKVIDSLRSGSYREEGKFLPWVLRIAHNLCIDHFRKIKRNPTIVDSEGNDVLNLIKFADISYEDKVMKEQTNARIKVLVSQLPDEQKEVVVLRHYAELSFKEIADMTDVSINTALGRMRYALINLRKLMKEQSITI